MPPSMWVCTACPTHSAASHAVWTDIEDPSTGMHTLIGSSSSVAKGRMPETCKGGMCGMVCQTGSEPTSITTASMASARVKVVETEAREADTSTTRHCADESI